MGESASELQWVQRWECEMASRRRQPLEVLEEEESVLGKEEESLKHVYKE